jgi:hypothetical protein
VVLVLVLVLVVVLVLVQYPVVLYCAGNGSTYYCAVKVPVLVLVQVY